MCHMSLESDIVRALDHKPKGQLSSVCVYVYVSVHMCALCAFEMNNGLQREQPVAFGVAFSLCYVCFTHYSHRIKLQSWVIVDALVNVKYMWLMFVQVWWRKCWAMMMLMMGVGEDLEKVEALGTLMWPCLFLWWLLPTLHSPPSF